MLNLPLQRYFLMDYMYNSIGLPAFKPGDKIKLDLSKDTLGGVYILIGIF